ncbi:hypothetical protein GCM10023323_28800 [Streptomyces thinghirensis]|uniref:Transposase n=1 Tax=Streptomyces thinghirensis TaxID=551547 RepID=A0ABP9T2J7_9ACTN
MALPDHADRILTDSVWAALTTTLAHAETAGHYPRRLLAEVGTLQELDSAEHPAEVLNWRITAHRTGARKQLAAEAPPAHIGQVRHATPSSNTSGHEARRAQSAPLTPARCPHHTAWRGHRAGFNGRAS